MLFPHVWRVRLLLFPFLPEQIPGMLVISGTNNDTDCFFSVAQQRHHHAILSPSVFHQRAIKLEDAIHLPAHIAIR